MGDPLDFAGETMIDGVFFPVEPRFRVLRFFYEFPMLVGESSIRTS